MSEATITLDSREEAVLLFGARDQYLREIRTALGAQLVGRGDQILIKGTDEQLALIERVFGQLRTMLRQQGSLSQEDVRTVLEKNPTYWGAKDFPNYPDELVYTPIKEPATRVAALISRLIWRPRARRSCCAVSRVVHLFQSGPPRLPKNQAGSSAIARGSGKPNAHGGSGMSGFACCSCGLRAILLLMYGRNYAAGGSHCLT